jgi:rubrerythrin
MKMKQLEELILQSLEHEMGGVKVYEMALSCAVNAELKEEWEKYFEQTKTHVQILEGVCEAMKLDPKQETPGRRVVRAVGQGLLEGMKLARSGGDPKAAEIVACEAVVLAETKDHLDWELLGKCAEHLTGSKADTLKSACETVEEQEDEHLYHTKGWCREIWLESLGLKAILPPPEERKNVKTAISAARAEQAADKGR